VEWSEISLRGTIELCLVATATIESGEEFILATPPPPSRLVSPAFVPFSPSVEAPPLELQPPASPPREQVLPREVLDLTGSAGPSPSRPVRSRARTNRYSPYQG